MKIPHNTRFNNLRSLVTISTSTTTTPTKNPPSLWMAAWMKDRDRFDAVWDAADAADATGTTGTTGTTASSAHVHERRDLAFAENEHGWNALHHACVHNQTHMIQQLLAEDFGCELAATSVRNGWRPLHYACGFGQQESVDLLLTMGDADLEVNNDKSYACMGFTPFHRAIRWWLSPGKPNCIGHLLKVGVNAAALTEDGKTAAHIANPEVHEALDEKLLQHLATRPDSVNADSVRRLRTELKIVQEQWATMS